MSYLKPMVKTRDAFMQEHEYNLSPSNPRFGNETGH